MRVGIGNDVHRLVEGRKLVLGGVTIPYEKGLLGHSDADVLTHAICDALLGAAGLGDIGLYFPDTDPAFKDIYSIDLLKICCRKLMDLGFAVTNIDATIFAEKPKLAPHREAMVRTLARALDLAPDAVNVKATTTEGLGMIGQGEGIAAMAVALIDDRPT
jgi:2-C-methyl-D-erythritol 2,4-cyclodiphosphate synthase